MMLLSEAATSLLRDLTAYRLEVIKLNTGAGYVRIPVSQNAEWYQRFCSHYMGRRRRFPRQRTIIKRCHTIRTLQTIANCGQVDTTYADRLRPFLRERSRLLRRAEAS